MAALTAKQEAFCQRYIETGSGTEAYRLAYGTKAKTETVAPNASRLLATSKIAARVRDLREATIERVHGVTVASLIAELEEARQVGKGREQAAAMVAATLGKAKLAGLDKDAGDDSAAPQPASVQVTITDARKPSADA